MPVQRRLVSAHPRHGPQSDRWPMCELEEAAARGLPAENAGALVAAAWHFALVYFLSADALASLSCPIRRDTSGRMCRRVTHGC